ncbi:uncharacterized protein LOC114239610 [Bombyx mandarina]|uniref:Uncharacterized protein LOC114239610 n=1 Tax=Bombyx mandarina TaxID=7092 RepID=A0A6J2J974_BOMMA|nr:uncharacterized protein LOC114239610 [Bombyx mandarina]
MVATTGELIRSKFNLENRVTFNVCHINAQSIASHYSELDVTFTDANVHAVLISESWLKPHLPSAAYSLPGFILIRNDRVDRRGGGVAIYLQASFSYKVIASSSSKSSNSAEYLFLEVWVKGVKTLLGVVYCPPSVDYFSSLDSILESLGSDYAHHIIMGDFNTDLLVPLSTRSRKLLDLVESVSLHILPLQATHHNIEGEDTWLDLILTSNPDLVYSHGQFPAPGFSHHDLIYLSYVLKPPKSKPKVLRVRCFGRMDGRRLCEDAAKISWDELTAATSIDDKVTIFNAQLQALYDNHAPVRKFKMKRPPAPLCVVLALFPESKIDLVLSDPRIALVPWKHRRRCLISGRTMEHRVPSHPASDCHYSSWAGA